MVAALAGNDNGGRMNYETYLFVLDKVGAAASPEAIFNGYKSEWSEANPNTTARQAALGASERLFDFRFAVSADWLHGYKVQAGDCILHHGEFLKVLEIDEDAVTVLSLENGVLPRFYPPSKTRRPRMAWRTEPLLTIVPEDLLHLAVVWVSGAFFCNNLIDGRKSPSFGKLLSVHFELRRLLDTLRQEQATKKGGK